jgi:hypothetical protein
MRQQRRPARFGATGETDGNLGRVEVHVVADAHDRNHPLRLEERVQAVRVLWRHAFDVQPKLATACYIALDHFGVLLAARDLETARVNPVQRLPGIVAESLDPLSSECDEVDQELALAGTADHAGSTRRGLGTDVVLIDEHDVLDAAFDKVERGRRTKSTGPDDDHIGLAHHRIPLTVSLTPDALAFSRRERSTR